MLKMKTQSIQFKFLITIISAMLAVTLFVGGLSIYELDNFIRLQTEDFVNVTCEKDASQINDVFGDMENAVHIMESYVLGLIKDYSDVVNPERQLEIIKQSDEMFIDVAKNTDDSVAYYFRLDPEISHSICGFFYSKEKGEGDFVLFETTDLSLYDRDDTEHVGWYWQPYDAGKPVWMLPYYNQNNGIYMISYVVPLYCDNKFFGVVGMDFDYTVLIDKIHNMKIYENGFAHLEYEGNVIHDERHEENKYISESPEEYLRVSKNLKNGMTLVLSASYNDIKQIRYEVALKIVIVVCALFMLFSSIAIYLIKRIVYPLKKLTEAAVKLSDGDYGVQIEHCDTYEINLLSTAFENMTLHLREHERLQHLLAYRDTLTGLRNTNSYWAWIVDFDKEIESKEIDFGVIVLDINYLKETNDKYGHDAGNNLIVAAARIISGIFKRSPVFRIGGDEFLVLLQNRDLEEYKELLEKFDEECRNTLVPEGNESIPVSVAKGFSRYDSKIDLKFMDVFNRADDAMYENKRQTRVRLR